jgi:hypothetical protein
MFRGLLLICVCLAACLQAEVLDRVAIYSGTQVITELQLDEEMRVTALLNRAPVVRTAEARRSAAQRLLDQMLVEREMHLSRYPLPGSADVDRYFDQIKQQFGTREAFEQALGRYDLSDAVLRAHLSLQLMMMRFIDYRFRPDVAISDMEITNYYEAHLRAWETDHRGAPTPSLTASREAIRNLLIEQRADEALDDWLQESRKQVHLVYLDRTLE